MGLQVSHGVHSEVGGIQCGGIHQGEECNLDCPELSGTETPFDREEFLSARLFRFHGGDGQTIRAGIHLAAGAGGAAFGGAEHGVGASAAFRRLLTGPFEGLTEISPRLCRGSFNYDFSNTGTLVYVDGAASLGVEFTLALVDRDGRAEELNAPRAFYGAPRVSPDGRRFLVAIHETDDDDAIWVHDLSGRTAPRRLTFEGRTLFAVWTPNGERITFGFNRDGDSFDLYEIPADGSGVPTLLASSEENLFPFSWTKDEQFLSYWEGSPGDGDLLTLRAEGGETTPYYAATGAQFNSAFSPNGKWVVYQSFETGESQIWVQPFPATGAKTQITTEGGSVPMWSPDGQELFYANEESELVSVVVVDTDSGTYGRPESLPVTGILRDTFSGGDRNYDIMPDGQKFLVVRRPEQTGQPQIYIILNWFEELKERVPVP